MKIKVCAGIAAFVAFAVVVNVATRSAMACGHDGFFFGGGYQQLFMYTPEDRLRGAQQITSSQIKFGPGYGANFLVGYDFKGSRWGLQMPFEYSYIRINGIERIHYFGLGLEGILHLASWENGIDVNLVGGVGWSILPEGPIEDNSGAMGVNVGMGPGFNYFFVRDPDLRASVYVQVPIRMVHFFGNNLSASGTTALQVPIRVGLSVGF